MPQEEPAAIQSEPIPLDCARRTQDAGSQTGPSDLPEDPSWEEVESLLQQVKSLDLLYHEVRQDAFVALDRYHAFHPEPNPVVDRWRTRVAMKREEMEHLDDWLVARRERIRREREEAERQVRAQVEVELQEARRRRQEKEEAIQAARAR